MLVFLDDAKSFSPIDGATLLRDDYAARYDLAKIINMTPQGTLDACRLPTVNDESVASANEGLE